MESHQNQLPAAEGVRLSRRDRVRAATIDEIKATAMRLMREYGADVRFADIAREMGLSAPALYRYFDDRDALLTALMIDGFHDFGTQIARSLEATPKDDLAARIEAAARAYRRFATADPQRFSLLFGLPAPGYVRNAKGPAVHANITAMAVFEELVRTVIDHGASVTPLVRAVGPAMTIEIESRQAPDRPHIPTSTYQALLHTLAAIHGFACLEAFGHLDWIAEPARDELFDAQIELVVQAMGSASAEQ